MSQPFVLQLEWRQFKGGGNSLWLNGLMAFGDYGLLLFFIVVLSICVVYAPRLFTPRHGRRHRLLGVVYLGWLVVGVALNITWNFDSDVGGSGQGAAALLFSIYDIILGMLGSMLTASAAKDFQKAHAHIQNVASGPLDVDATVTYDEMIEHLFYQVLNVAQIIFLHASFSLSSFQNSLWLRTSGMLVVSSLWLIRDRFPVHHFSANYTQEQGWSIVTVLYRIKKWQYVFYKHLLLHGLNLTVVLYPTTFNLSPVSPSFRSYWVMLNTAYTMEFFLQTLVKRRYIPQWSMLVLNGFLMIVGSYCAIRVVLKVHPLFAWLSLLLNFSNRGHEFVNVWISIFCGTLFWLFSSSVK